jgi:LDH2 family malate/lactate/ureidoglycolate dehydrogenase
VPRIAYEELLALAERLIGALGASAEDARTVAEHLAGANLAGHDSHGIIRIAQYRDHVRQGKIRPDRKPQIVRQTTTTALLDGNLAWGQVVARRAMETAIAKARANGVSAVCVRNCYHVGRAGVYPLQAAEEGFIAQIHCNGHGVVRVAPWGGTEPRLATNPMAIAIPTGGRPILVDITTSVVAEGKVRLARNAGKALPEGWVLDGAGRPATDPAELYRGGSLLPFGGREGHKGYGLSVVVDLLGGALSGAGCGLLTDKVGNGLFIQVTDPAAFGEREEFYGRAAEFLAYLKTSPPRAGGEVLWPGEPEERTAERRRREGIDIDEGTWRELDLTH